MCDNNFEADKIRYLYNITKFGSDVLQKGGCDNLKAFKKFMVPPCQSQLSVAGSKSSSTYPQGSQDKLSFTVILVKDI